MKNKTNHRIYLNLTNRCNVKCPFCSMYSGPDKSTFLSFDIFKQIIDKADGLFEIQLEGGEPLLHDDLYLFLEYIRSTKRCSKITISTNGILIKQHLERLSIFAKISKIELNIKLSINYYLLELDSNIMKYAEDLYLATEFIDNINIILNVRLRKDNDYTIITELKSRNLTDISNIFYFQNYGRMDDDSYEKPYIKQNIEQFELYSSNGLNFNHDLIGRSEYENHLK